MASPSLKAKRYSACGLSVRCLQLQTTCTLKVSKHADHLRWEGSQRWEVAGQGLFAASEYRTEHRSLFRLLAVARALISHCARIQKIDETVPHSLHLVIKTDGHQVQQPAAHVRPTSSAGPSGYTPPPFQPRGASQVSWLLTPTCKLLSGGQTPVQALCGQHKPVSSV